MKARIWTALIVIYLAWGSTYLAIHYAVQSIPPFFMTGTRFLVAGVILYVWRRLAGDPAPSRAQWASTAMIGSLLLVGGIGLVSWAEKFVPSGIAAMIVAAAPVWTVLIEAIRSGGNRPTWLTVTGVLVGLAGIFILIDPVGSARHTQSSNLLGAGALLLAALSWSIGSIYSQRAKLPKSGILGTGMELIAGSLGCYLLGLITGESTQLNLSAITLPSMAGLAYLILIGSLVGFVCFTWLLRVAPPTLVVTHAYVNPVVAVMLGSFLAKEVVTPKLIIATLLILSAVLLVHSKKAEKKPTERPLVRLSEASGND